MTKEIITPTEVFSVKIVGDTPLIVHRWREKGERRCLGPWVDFCDSLYWISDEPEFPVDIDIEQGKFGFPTRALKNSAVEVGFKAGLIDKKTRARGAFQILGDLAEIEGRPRIREDVVRVGMRMKDQRFRAEFPTWSMNLSINYRPDTIKKEQIKILLSMAGMLYGIGEWRPEKDGKYGTFHVDGV